MTCDLRIALTVLTVLAMQLRGQVQQQVTLQVQVMSVSGRDVYLDKGSAAGLAIGQIVRLYPPGGETEAVVRSVSSTSARAELAVGVGLPPIGTGGEVTVPRTEPVAPPPVQPGPGSKPAPSHPPWSRSLNARNPDDPLLVPTFGQKPDERPMTLNGRAFVSTNWSRDDGGTRANEYLLSRVGMSAQADNALGVGDRIRFAGEFDDRLVKVPDRPDENDLQGRVDVLSMEFGSEQWAPYGAEIGRFLSPHLPEIGLVDGVEGVLRFDNGIRMGAGFGAYPRPFPGRASGEDIGLHVFADYTADQRRSLAATVGVQKTWHRGAPDRDLLLLRAEARPREDLRLYASAKIDYYTSGDNRKSPGIEVTEFLGQAQWNLNRVGAGLTLSHFAWPDLLRTEYQDLPDDLVRNGKVDRVSLSTWLRPTNDLRLTGRADTWHDQDHNGTAFELGADWSNFLDTDTSLSVQVFRTDGGVQSGPGLRVSANRRFGDVFARASYRWYAYELEQLLVETETYRRQSIEFGASWAVGDFDLDLQVEHSFGDQENNYAIGLYAQWRF